MTFLSWIAFSVEDFLPAYPRGEFAVVDEYIQGVALVVWDALAHREFVRAGGAGWVSAIHADAVPGERSALAGDGVPARKSAAVPVLVAMCSGPRIIGVLKIAGGVCVP